MSNKNDRPKDDAKDDWKNEQVEKLLISGMHNHQPNTQD